MSLASRKHSSLPKAIRKDSPVARNRRGPEEVPQEELVSVALTTMPPSTNSMYKPFNGRFMVNIKARADKEAMAWEARSQYRGKPLEGELECEVELTWPTKRHHDVDNIKSLLDSMKGILWVDDVQIVKLTTTKRYEKGVSLVVVRARKKTA